MTKMNITVNGIVFEISRDSNDIIEIADVFGETAAAALSTFMKEVERAQAEESAKDDSDYGRWTTLADIAGDKDTYEDMPNWYIPRREPEFTLGEYLDKKVWERGTAAFIYGRCEYTNYPNLGIRLQHPQVATDPKGAGRAAWCNLFPTNFFVFTKKDWEDLTDVGYAKKVADDGCDGGMHPERGERFDRVEINYSERFAFAYAVSNHDTHIRLGFTLRTIIEN